MKRLAITGAIAGAMFATSAHAQFARHEAIAFETSAVSVADVLNGVKGQKLALAGILRVPKVGQKNPVVVLLHHAGGLGAATANIHEWSRVLNEAGIATFAVDSYAARGVDSLADVVKVPALTRLHDAFGAQRVLAKHPLIDAGKIVVMGFSHGGAATMYSNLVRFQEQYGEAKFAAHISVYGSCTTKYGRDDRLASPLLILHGSADDWISAEPCRAYAARLKDAGNDVRFIEYADAHHVFDAPVLATITKFPNVPVPSRCQFEESEGKILNSETKRPLTPADSCMTKGPSAGYNEAATKKAHADVIDFLKGVFAQ